MGSISEVEFALMQAIDDIERDNIEAKNLVDSYYNKESLFKSLKDKYQQSGAFVSDDVINKAIDEHLSKRLKFKNVELSFFGNILAKLIVFKRKVFSFFALIFVAVCVTSFSFIIYNNNVINNLKIDAENYIDSQLKMLSFVDSILSNTKLALNEIEKNGVPYDFVAINFNKVISAIANFKETSCVSSGSYENLNDTVALKGYIDSVTECNDILKDKLVDINKEYNYASLVYDFIRYHESLKNDVNFVRMYKEDKSLAMAFDSVYVAISGQGDVKGAVSYAKRLFGNLNLANIERNNLALVSSKFKLLNLEDKERNKIELMISNATHYLDTLDVQNAQYKVVELNAYYDSLNDLLSKEVSLVIVDRPEELSGVIRTHDLSGGKSYYLVVEAIDVGGNFVPMNIKSWEDGEEKEVYKFAINVPENVFRKIKSDKKDNGHIDDNIFAVKKKGKIDFTYNVEEIKEPKYIFRW